MPDDHKEFCSRCRREAPASTPGPGGKAAEGWTFIEDESGNLRELVCPGCHTSDDVDAWVARLPARAGTSQSTTSCGLSSDSSSIVSIDQLRGGEGH